MTNGVYGQDMTEQTQFASGDVLIVADNLVVEVFHRSYERSVRLPAAWLGVQVQSAKHDEFQVKFGRADPPDQAIYGEDLNVSNYLIVFRLPAADEPRLRAFFTEVAARAGRAS